MLWRICELRNVAEMYERETCIYLPTPYARLVKLVTCVSNYFEHTVLELGVVWTNVT